MASSAIPGVFPVQVINDQTFSDGGVKMGVNVFDAVVRCRQVGGARVRMSVLASSSLPQAQAMLQCVPTTADCHFRRRHHGGCGGYRGREDQAF